MQSILASRAKHLDPGPFDLLKVEKLMAEITFLQ